MIFLFFTMSWPKCGPGWGWPKTMRSSTIFCWPIPNRILESWRTNSRQRWPQGKPRRVRRSFRSRVRVSGRRDSTNYSKKSEIRWRRRSACCDLRETSTRERFTSSVPEIRTLTFWLWRSRSCKRRIRRWNSRSRTIEFTWRGRSRKIWLSWREDWTKISRRGWMVRGRCFRAKLQSWRRNL